MLHLLKNWSLRKSRGDSDGLWRGYRMIVPEACVADVHASPHFASLYDMHKKYLVVLRVAEVLAFYKSLS
jgi:maleamate amidohydrolase